MTILNDVDYLNLATNNIDDYTGRYVTSRLNYFLTNDSQYFGTYIKYFEDLKAPNNSKTRQELPVLQYHKFTDTLLLDNITYSFDTMMRNYVIRDGVSATQYELSVTLKFSMPLFDDYLRFSFSENLYATYVDYDNGVKTWNEHFYKNYHQFALYTDLAKAYDNFFHTVNFRLEYTLPSSNHGQITQDFITTNTETKNISATLVQFFYNADGRKSLRHYISQPYHLEKQYYQYGELENRIDLSITTQLANANYIRYYHHI